MEAAADLSAAALALQVDLLQLPPEIPAPGAPSLRGVLDRLFAHWLSLPDTAASSSPPPLRIRRDPNPSLVELAAGPVEVADEAYEFCAPKYFDFVNDETEDEVRAAERWFEAFVSHAPSQLKSALGKKRRDGKSAPLEPLTKIQRVYIGRLTEKYGDNYKAMFMDTKLNAMQHSVGTLKKLCERYHGGGKNILYPLGSTASRRAWLLDWP